MRVISNCNGINDRYGQSTATEDFYQPCGPALVSMQIRIQLFISMWIRIQGAKPMRIRILSDFKVTKS
jgi:hypothetical protein